ncbi:MAG TPA: hypothetical protein VH351_08060 [Bryobacteraceae bacterium]|jgi:hypothetical protein|nr:hypothetical protein [Bryobacteraceae bacterium]
MTPQGNKAKRAASLDDLCPIDRFLTDGSFVTPVGSYARCFGIDACDPDGAMPGDLAVVSSRITELLRTIGTDVTLYQYFLSVEGFPLVTEFDSSVAQRRTEFLRETADFKSMMIVWCITAKFTKTPTRTIANLRVASAAIANAIPVRPMDEHETAAFFSYLMTLAPGLATRRLLSRQRVAQQIATQPIRWSNDGLMIGRQHVRQFCLSRRPVGTRADLFAGLRKLRGNIILCSEYRRATPEQVCKQVNQLEPFTGVFKRKFANLAVHATARKELEATAGTKAADKSTDDLGKVLIELGDGTTYGHYSLIGLVHGRDPKALEELLPQIQQVFSDPAQAGMMIEDPIGQHSAYQALLLQPAQNVRRRWWRDTHVANLAFAFLPGIGHPRSTSLASEYLVCYQTTERRPWFYDPYDLPE